MNRNSNSSLTSELGFSLNFVFFVGLISLFPFILFFFFTLPCSDDIFYHNYAQGKTIAEFLSNHYNTWTGRYFSNWMMAANPFTTSSDPNVYPWMMFSIFVVFWGSLVFLFSSLTRSLNVKKHLPFFLSVIFIALFFHKMPRTADSFYWFAGASSHLLPLSLIFIATGFYFSNTFWLSTLVIAFVSAIISGSNETLAVQWIFTLSFVLFYQKSIFKRWDARLFLPLLVALIGFAFLYFAPGNAIRAKELKGGHDIGLLLIKPWGLVLETSVRYLSLSALILIILFFEKFKELNNHLSFQIKEKTSRIYLNVFGLGVFVLTFVPSVWTMGGLPPRRVLNNTYLFILIYGTFLLILNAHKLEFILRWSQRMQSVLSVKRWRLIFLVSTLFFFNNLTAWKDLIGLPKFVESLEDRSLIVSSGQNTDLILPKLKHFPETFYYEDITVKSDDYRNVVFSEFFKLKSVRLDQDYP